VSVTRSVAAELSPFERWMSGWWPSQRLGFDPLESVLCADRYAPVTIKNWKLTPFMRRVVLSRRVAHELTFSSGRLTVVIPFRDREAHLRELLPVLVPKLREQGIEHRILVVEQEEGKPFNRGKLINVGIQHAADHTDYYCIHDADAIPVTADYRCPSQPLRLVHEILGEQGAARREPHYFSGAVSIRKEQVFAVNGFSNEYWGWGKEDDDLFFRLMLGGYTCYYDTQGVFHDLPNPKHQARPPASAGVPPHIKRNRQRRSLLVRGQLDPASDGLSTVRYSLLGEEHCGSYDKVRVAI
jgi:hypothetical protein